EPRAAELHGHAPAPVGQGGEHADAAARHGHAVAGPGAAPVDGRSAGGRGRRRRLGLPRLRGLARAGLDRAQLAARALGLARARRALERADHAGHLLVGAPERLLEVAPHLGVEPVAPRLELLEAALQLRALALGLGAQARRLAALVLERDAARVQLGERALEAAVLAREQLVGALEHAPRHAHAP